MMVFQQHFISITGARLALRSVKQSLVFSIVENSVCAYSNGYYPYEGQVNTVQWVLSAIFYKIIMKVLAPHV